MNMRDELIKLLELNTDLLKYKAYTIMKEGKMGEGELEEFVTAFEKYTSEDEMFFYAVIGFVGDTFAEAMKESGKNLDELLKKTKEDKKDDYKKSYT